MIRRLDARLRRLEAARPKEPTQRVVLWLPDNERDNTPDMPGRRRVIVDGKPWLKITNYDE